jgi:hypothetical protein
MMNGRMELGVSRPMFYVRTTENPLNLSFNPSFNTSTSTPSYLNSNNMATNNMATNNMATNNVVTNNVVTNNVATNLSNTIEEKTYNINSILLTGGIIGILLCFIVLTLVKVTRHPKIEGLNRS